MDARAHAIETLLAVCGGDKVAAAALACGCGFELAFRAADDAQPDESDPGALRGEAVVRPASRVMGQLTRQMEKWTAALEEEVGRGLPALRKRMRTLVDRDTQGLLGRMRLSLRPRSAPASFEGPPPTDDAVINNEPLSPSIPVATRAHIDPAFRRTSVPRCQKCGSLMEHKTGKNGSFMGCTAFPSCRWTSAAVLGVGCPEPGCGGELEERRVRDVLDGQPRTICGCTNYPDCDFVQWHTPERVPCYRCRMPFVVVLPTGQRMCINGRCGLDSAVIALPESDIIDDLLRNAALLFGSIARAAPALTRAAGVASGLTIDELQVALDQYVGGIEAGVAWRRRIYERAQARPSDEEAVG